MRPTKNGLTVVNVSEAAKSFGFMLGDIVRSINGEKISMQTVGEIAQDIQSKKVGTKYTITVVRGEKEIIINAKTVTKNDKFVFEINPNATNRQLEMRQNWMKRL